jgi:organic radical activating enzyme
MTNLSERIRTWWERPEPLPPGLYQYKAPPDASLHYRLHLRLNPDGTGVLLVNASTILHVNQTAAEYAYHLIQRTPPEEVASQVARRYRVSKTQARQDYQEFFERIETLLLIPDLDPVMYLGFDREEPYAEHLSAPYRLDCALTYRQNADGAPEAGLLERARTELGAEEWKTIMGKAWEAGIPHIIFTGGEPTLREDLVELLEHAESLGQISGLITNGYRLSDSEYLDKLLFAGLDHVVIVLQPNEEQTWESLASFLYWFKVLEADLHVTAHLTITPDNAAFSQDLLKRLAGTGIQAVSLSASSVELAAPLEEARNRAAELGLSLDWDIPVPYSAFNPVALELEGTDPPSGAGRAWLYVEPDGDVLPAQGSKKVLGNILKDSWEAINAKL